MFSGSNFKKNNLRIIVVKCAHLLQAINRIQPVEINISVRDLFHENHVAKSKEFKT